MDGASHECGKATVYRLIRGEGEGTLLQMKSQQSRPFEWWLTCKYRCLSCLASGGFAARKKRQSIYDRHSSSSGLAAILACLFRPERRPSEWLESRRSVAKGARSAKEVDLCRLNEHDD